MPFCTVAGCAALSLTPPLPAGATQVVITNVPEDHFEEREANVFPGRTDETYKVPFTKVVYIESTDFREVDVKGYFGLAPHKSVMLR